MTAAGRASDQPKVVYRNKTKVLVLSTRGVGARVRHLMDDLRIMLPHSKKEGKYDGKDDLQGVIEVCDLRGCDACLLFEARKNKDFYLWMAKVVLLVVLWVVVVVLLQLLVLLLPRQPCSLARC